MIDSNDKILTQEEQDTLLKKENRRKELALLELKVKDLLNQIVIKLNNIEMNKVEYDDDDYPIETDRDATESYLASVKNYCVTVLKFNYSASDYENKYYISTCW